MDRPPRPAPPAAAAASGRRFKKRYLLAVLGVLALVVFYGETRTMTGALRRRRSPGLLRVVPGIRHVVNQLAPAGPIEDDGGDDDYYGAPPRVPGDHLARNVWAQDVPRPPPSASPSGSARPAESEGAVDAQPAQAAPSATGTGTPAQSPSVTPSGAPASPSGTPVGTSPAAAAADTTPSVTASLGPTGTPTTLYSPKADPGEQAAYAALRRLLDDPMADCTPAWRTTLEEYGAFHRAAVRALRARDPAAPRVVVFSCYETPDDSPLVSEDCGGFADRLVGMTHTFLLALRHRYVFFAQWQEAHRVFTSPYLGTDYIYNASLVDYDGRSKVYESFIGCPERTGGPCPIAHENITTILSGDTNYVRINRGGVRWGGPEALASLYAMGLDAPHVGGCIYRALVTPAPATVARFLRHALFILNRAHRVVAVHERTGDRTMHQVQNVTVDWDSATWKCATQHAVRIANESGVPALLFLVSDSLEYKMRALDHFGRENLFITETSPYHIAKQALLWDGLIYRPSPFPNPLERLMGTYGEWWLLSLADLLIMPGFSGYSRTAFAFSQKPGAILTQNFEARYLYGCDRFVAQQELADLGAGF